MNKGAQFLADTIFCRGLLNLSGFLLKTTKIIELKTRPASLLLNTRNCEFLNRENCSLFSEDEE